MKYPTTDILIVTYNARQKLTRCLRSVIRHTRDVSYQITVLDNASTDGTAEYLERAFSKKIKLIKSRKNLGFSGGVNLLLCKTNHPWVVFLDDDAEVTAGWLTRFYVLAKKNPSLGIISGKIVYPNRRIFCAEFSIVPFGSVGRGEVDRGYRDYTKEVDAVPGPCWLVPRSVIEKVGLFDERFFPCQYEDIDYCLRVRLAGYKIFYHGKVEIIHHNLFRKGSEIILNQNIRRFFKKWRKVMHRFPLCSLSNDDRLIYKGAMLLRNEVFMPTHPVFGKWAGLNSRFSQTFYRGIAFIAARQYEKAGKSFREIAAANRHELMNVDYETTALYYVLSRYFLRLGLRKEAQECAGYVIGRIAPFERISSSTDHEGLSGLEPQYLQLHQWCIRINGNDPDYLRILKGSLPYYRNKLSSKSKIAPASRLLEISFMNKAGKNEGHAGMIDKKLIPSHCPQFGLYRLIDKKKNRASVVMTRKRFLRDNLIFHGGFLGPLALLLHYRQASLVHGALLRKNARGFLILGEKGAGKSTLSTACLEREFYYFSDEHPILELKGNSVHGKSFVNDIALPVNTVRENFPHLKDKMEWSKSRRKYLLDPLKLSKNRIGTTTEIDLVIFPVFKKRVRFSIKQMDREIFFKRLLEDEYLKIMLEDQSRNPEESAPRKIASVLSEAARGYVIEYGPEDIRRLPSILERL